jgi:GNAT superfamily N-acetyltransferase
MSHEIRLLPASELALLIPLIRAFFAEGNIQGNLNEPYAIRTLRGYVESGNGFVLAYGTPIRAGIAGLMYVDLATAERCCSEFFWYVDVPERGSSIGVRLLNEFEKEAGQRGAKRILMMHLETEKTAQFARLYERRGYVKREQVYIKGVSP